MENFCVKNTAILVRDIIDITIADVKYEITDICARNIDNFV